MVDGYPRQIWWNPDGETIVESYSITDMAHGTPLGKAENDERYGKEGAFLIEAGISSSYHIANFFGLTAGIHQPEKLAKAASRAAAESPSAQTDPAGFADLTACARPQQGAAAAGGIEAAFQSPGKAEGQARRRARCRRGHHARADSRGSHEIEAGAGDSFDRDAFSLTSRRSGMDWSSARGRSASRVRARR